MGIQFKKKSSMIGIVLQLNKPTEHSKCIIKIKQWKKIM